MNKKQGVYRITNKIDGKTYYGSASISFNKRWREHRRDLRKNKHGNRYLQNAWNKYGANNFEFVIILVCAPKDCLYYEQLFLDKYFDSGVNCYNLCPTANSFLGYKRSDKERSNMIGNKRGLGNKSRSGQKRSREEIEKQSKALNGKPKPPGFGENLSKILLGNTRGQGGKGKKKPPMKQETKDKISKTSKGRKISPETIEKRRHKRAKLITFNNETLNSLEWEKKTGIKHDVIMERLRGGWTIERTLTTPMKQIKKI